MGLAKISALFEGLLGSGSREDTTGQYDIQGEWNVEVITQFVNYLNGREVVVDEENLFEFLVISDYFLTDLTEFIETNVDLLDNIRKENNEQWENLCSIS